MPLYFLSPAARKHVPWVLVLLGAMVVVVAYLQAVAYPFVLDDVDYLPNNADLIGLQASELWRLLVQPYNMYEEFLPLRDLSYWLDLRLFGLEPAAFRLTGILIYLACLPLVYGLTVRVWRYFRPGDHDVSWQAAIVTVLFALHPAHIEAVVWIAGRKDVLAAMFSLLALWLAVSARREQGLSVAYAVATLLALVCAMLSKASSVGVAPLISLIWLVFGYEQAGGGRRFRVLLWSGASLFLAAGLALAFATLIPTRVPIYWGHEAVVRSLAVLGWLVRLVISPEARHFFYPVLEDPHLYFRVALGVITLLACLSAIILVLRKRSLEAFTLAAFLLLCAPSLQLIPYIPPSLVSDRFVALAMWPILILIVALTWRLSPVPRVVLLLVIATMWGVQTIERTRDWHSLEALIDADIRAYPGHYQPAMYRIVTILLPQGKYREARELAGNIALPEYREVAAGLVEVEHEVYVGTQQSNNPKHAVELLWALGKKLNQPPAQTRWNSASYIFWEKSKEMLADGWGELITRFPQDMQVRYNAGLWLLDAKGYQGAVEFLRTAADSQQLPESERGNAYYSLGLALLMQGKPAAAEARLQKALQQTPPDLRAYCLLEQIYRRSGRMRKAESAAAACRN